MSKLISGIWYFNETLTYEGLLQITIDFISDKRAMDRIEVNSGVWYEFYVAYAEDGSYEEVYRAGTGWVNEAFRIIDFGSTPQSVSDEFYAWLTTNASKTGLNNLKTVTESIKKYVDSKDTDIKESVNSKAAAGAQSIDTSIAQIKDVPSDTAKYAGINKIGGMTYKIYEVSGVWVFNEEISIIEDKTYYINFENASSTYNRIQIAPDGGGEINYHNDDVTDYVYNGAWIDEVYRTVDFGSTPQSVSEEFYTWLSANAVMQNGTGARLESAKTTEMKSVGVNLIPYPYKDTTKTVNGITFTDNGDGSVTANGTATNYAVFYLRGSGNYQTLCDLLGISGGNYVLSGNPDASKGFIDIQSIESGNIESNAASGVIFNTDNFVNRNFTYIRIVVRNGVTVSNLTFKPMLNEGSTALPYTPYMESTLLVPEAVQAIDGYGWGINANCYNYVDWEKKQFVKRVTKLILTGQESWTYTTRWNGFQLIKNNYNVYENSYNLSSHYSVFTGSWTSLPDGCFGLAGTMLGIKDTRYADVTSFKEFLAAQYAAGNPLTFVYALSTPEVTDISDLLPEDNYIEVEGNGSITAVNEYGYDVPSEIVFNIKNNEQVNANTFVGDLIGKAQSAERDGAGRLLEDTYMSYSYDKVYTGETAAVSEFYAGETTYVSGVWYFNESMSLSDEGAITQNVNFVCEGVNCNLISVHSTSIRFDPLSTEIAYDVYYDNVWTDEAYRTVDFGEKDQLTSPEFYTWLCANARRVEA